MKIGRPLTIISELINVLIFIYFSIKLIKSGILDLIELSISAFGVFMSLISNIVSTLEEQYNLTK